MTTIYQKRAVHVRSDAINDQGREKSVAPASKSYSIIGRQPAVVAEPVADGFWEWNLKTGRAKFSPRWTRMLGHRNAGMKHLDDWKQLIHPEDRETAFVGLSGAVAAGTASFEFNCRLRHGDGGYRRLYSRVTVVRHANGKPWRIAVVDSIIDARKKIEEALIHAAESLVSASGVDFFRSLIRNLSLVLGTRDNLVAYCLDDPPTRMRTLAYYEKGQFSDNFEYDLAGTTCAVVIQSKECFYVPTGVSERWPIEKQYDRDSYLGVPMLDSAGKVIGLFACMDGRPMRQDPPHLALFRIFAVRAAAELERTLERQRTVVAERSRIMSDMHDGVGGLLISALSLVEHGEATQAQIAAALRDCIDDLRLAIDSLEPIDNELLPLLGNIRYRIEGRLQDQGIALDWQVQEVPELPSLTPQNVLQVLRILQEAFTNVIKHAHASSVSVATGVDASGQQVFIRIQDNGTGFVGNAGGRGLANMRHRAEVIGGRVEICPSPTGTTLSLLIPMA